MSIFIGLYRCAKFGWNRCSSFDNVEVLIVCTFGLKMPFHAPQIGVLGDMTPEMGCDINRTPKGTSIGGNGSSGVLAVSVPAKVPEKSRR